MTVSRRRFITDSGRIGLMSAVLPSLSMSTASLLAAQGPDITETMTVGAASVDITGVPGPELSGFLARKQPSTEIGTRLHARALYLKKNDETLLWIVLDSLCVAREIIDRVKNDLSEKYEIEPWRVVLSTTHTHSAPAASRMNNIGEANLLYVENVLLPGIFEVADAAKNSIEECFLVEATGEADLNFDRRNAATKHLEQRVPAVAWKRPDGSFKTVLIGYAMHPVCHCSGLIHAEWPGATAEVIRETFSQETEPFVIQGACGNLNPKDRRPDEDNIRQMGQTLVQSVAEQLKNAQPVRPYFSVRTRMTATLLDVQDEAAITAFARDNRKADPAPDDFIGQKLNKASDTWKAWAIGQLHGGGRDYLESEIAAIVLGHRAFVTAPFETLSWMNPELAKHTDINCFAVGYTNGCYNYLAHDAAYDEGGYESDSAKMWYINFRMKRGELERLAKVSAPLVELAAKSAGLK